MTAPWFIDSTEDRLAPSSLSWGFSSGSWSLFLLSKDKRATISMRSQIKTASFNITIKLKQRLVKNFNIWTKDLKKKMGRRRHMSKGECFQIEVIGFILMRPQWSSENLIGNFILIGLIELCFEKSWNWELMNRKIKSTQNSGTYEIIFLFTGK